MFRQWPASGPPDRLPVGFAAADQAVARAAHVTEGIDAVVIAPGAFAGASGAATPSWPELLAGFSSVTDDVLSHVAWLQAAARQAVRTSRPLRIVHLADATSAPLHAAAQAVAQLARCATLAQPGLIDVFSVALETAGPADHEPVAQLIARMLWSGDATALRGAELFARLGLDRPAPLIPVRWPPSPTGPRPCRPGSATGCGRPLPPVRRDDPINSPLTKYLSIRRCPAAGYRAGPRHGRRVAFQSY